MYYETLILGLVIGCIYSVTALGVNIIYGVMQIVKSVEQRAVQIEDHGIVFEFFVHILILLLA